MNRCSAVVGLVLVVVSTGTGVQVQGAEAGDETTSIAPLEIVTLHGARRSVPGRIGRAGEADWIGADVVVLDAKHHQIALNRSNRGWSYASGIGNRPGELFYPTEMDVDSSTKRIAIYEGGNRRIQIFDAQLGSVSVSEVSENVYGLAWWRGDSLVVGLPQSGTLLSVMDAVGALSDSVGALTEPDQLSRFEASARSTVRTAINRVRVATTPADEIWVVFVHLPLVQRYGRSGELRLERSLSLEGMGSLPRFAQAVWSPSDRPSDATYINIDGVQLPLVVKDIAVDPQSGTPVLLLGNDLIGTLDQDGRMGRVGEVVGCGTGFHRLAIDDGGRMVLLSSLKGSSLCEVQLDEVLRGVGSTAGPTRPVDH